MTPSDPPGSDPSEPQDSDDSGEELSTEARDLVARVRASELADDRVKRAILGRVLSQSEDQSSTNSLEAQRAILRAASEERD